MAKSVVAVGRGRLWRPSRWPAVAAVQRLDGCVGICFGGIAEVEQFEQHSFDSDVNTSCAVQTFNFLRSTEMVSFPQPDRRLPMFSFHEFSDQIHRVWTFSPHIVQGLGKVPGVPLGLPRTRHAFSKQDQCLN